jgi:hypothetical protein
MRFPRLCLPLVLSTFLWISAAQPAQPGTSSGSETAEGGGENAARGPVYVPLDSWVYPALQRLAALGLVPDQVSNMAPWTRDECRRQIAEAGELAEAAHSNEAMRLLSDLRAEFPESHSKTELRLESLYTRALVIRGTPLRDSYHFGQTVTNDYGRPYDKGLNTVAGFSGYASSGRFSAYLRGEYEQAPGRPAYSQQVQNLVSGMDGNPLHPALATASASRFEPLEMYVGVQLGFENITFGKQALWWGPGEDSAFAFSDNASPYYMLRLQQHPLTLPGRFARFAQIRTEIIFGELAGHQWPARPYVNAQKISLDLPLGLELGFTRSAFFGGVGRPLSLNSLYQSFFAVNSVDFGPYGYPDAPGDRHSGFDFRWHLPGVHHLITIYSDSYADDDPNPLDNPKRSAWAPGIYLSRIPGLPGLDLRFETYATWLYRADAGGNFLYWNSQYHDSYTDNGNLLGSWVGRDSRAYVGTSNYWFSAKTKLQGQFKQIKAGNQFLPGGGTQTDVSIAAEWAPRPEWLLNAQFQGERYNIPVLGGVRRDALASLQVTFSPENWSLKR